MMSGPSPMTSQSKSHPFAWTKVMPNHLYSVPWPARTKVGMQLRVVPNRPEFLQHVDTFSPGTAMGQQQTFTVFGLNVRYWGDSVVKLLRSVREP